VLLIGPAQYLAMDNTYSKLDMTLKQALSNHSVRFIGFFLSPFLLRSSYSASYFPLIVSCRAVMGV
jgi:hypothetical protein